MEPGILPNMINETCYHARLTSEVQENDVFYSSVQMWLDTSFQELWYEIQLYENNEQL